MRIILMGPPGVGKGTEAELLIKHYQIPHISTGNIFRSLFNGTSEIGKIAKFHIDQGELVPDDITNQIVKERLESDDVKDGFLFDGYPRNIAQAKAFEEILANKGWKLDAVINISAPDELIIKRISGRRVCSFCGAVYHVNNKPPKVEGICDKDGHKLIHRVDDMESTVKRRLRIYNHQTAPIIHYYNHLDVFFEIDGSQTISHTNEQVMKVLGEK